MASQLENLIGEISKVHEALSDYAENLGTYLFNPSQPFPEFNEANLTVDELLALAKNNKDAAVDTTAGAISSTVYKVAGISRELSTRSMSKAMLYDLAISQAAQETNEVRADSGKKVAQLRSATPEQTEGT